VKSILVTGGLGFIATNFIKYMMWKYPDYFIINLDKVTYCAGLDNFAFTEQNPNYKFIKGDIADYKILNEVFEKYKPQYVVHLAAESAVHRSIKDSNIFIQSNVVGTYRLLEACKAFEVERVCVSGTDEEYGPIKNGFVKENAVLNPTSPYSASKAASSILSISYHHMYKLPVIVFRPSNNYGPYQYPEKVVPIFIINALRDLRLPIEGNGSHIRNWIHVMDNCTAIDTILHKGEIGEIYNISSDYECSIKELAEKILYILHKPKSLITFKEERLSDDSRYGIDSSKLRSLGWKPLYDFNNRLAETIKWYRDNEYWWRDRI